MLCALSRSGCTDEQIAELYPDLSDEAIRQALDLERSLLPSAA